MVDIDSPFWLSENQRHFFKENGFVKLPKVFSPEELNHYKSEFGEKVATYNTQTKPLEERTVYEKAFLQIHNLWTKSEKIKQFVLGKRLGRIAAELLGCKGVRLYHDQALFKEPGGGITPWHADQYYWPVDSDRTITAWIPLQDVPLEMGPLAFARGSYKLKLGRDLEISESSENQMNQGLKEFELFEEPFSFGEVSFHTGWTFHRAGLNNTNQLRAVMTIIYVDQDIRLMEPQNKDQQNDRDWWCPGVQVGQVLNSPLNPLVYSIY